MQWSYSGPPWHALNSSTCCYNSYYQSPHLFQYMSREWDTTGGHRGKKCKWGQVSRDSCGQVLPTFRYAITKCRVRRWFVTAFLKWARVAGGPTCWNLLFQPQYRRRLSYEGDVSDQTFLFHFFVLFFIRAIFKLYICIPTNCTQLIYFINNALKHMYCLKL